MQVTPAHSFSSGLPIKPLDILPNPASGSSAGDLSKLVAIVSTEGMILVDVDAYRLSAPLPGSFTSGSWSAKGKQIVFGTSDGRLVQFTPDGTQKAEILLPPELDMNEGFAPTFVEWIETDTFFVGYAPAGSGVDEPVELFIIVRTKEGIIFNKYFDPLDFMGVAGRSSHKRYIATLKAWGPTTRNLIFSTSGLASEIAVMRANGERDGQWESLVLDETARAIFPAGKTGVSDDMACLGLALDLTSGKPVKRGIVGGVEAVDLAPCPRLLAYSQEGVIVSFDVQYPDGGAYPGMVTIEDMASTLRGDSGMEVSESPSRESASPVAAATSPSASPFGSKPTPFGQAAFASGSAFGATSSPSSFGAPSTSTSAFSTAGKSPTIAFGSPSTSSSFGQTSFGQGQPSAFGQSTIQTSPAQSSSAFGKSQTLSSGQTSFGQSTPAFGSSSFVSGSSPSAFGPSTFGQSSKPVGAVVTASNAPAFGSSSPSSASSLGFGAFGGTTSAKQSSFGFGSFGSASGPSSSSTVSPFGGGGGTSSFGSGSAFGSSTAFGTGSAFGSKSNTSSTVFGGLGQASQAAATSALISSSEGNLGFADDSPGDFGLGSFASSLQSTSKGVPGLEDSPPSSPVIGATKKPPGLDDDSPPSTPTITRPPQAPQAAQRITSSSSSFIRPATGFASSSSGFGVASSPSQSSSTPRTTTPSALSAPPTHSPASTTSSPAFGKSSVLAASKPATSAFGANSVPSAGFSSILGGFGNFSKPEVRGTATGFATFGQKAANQAPGTFSAMLSGSQPKVGEVPMESPGVDVESPSSKGYDVPETPAQLIQQASKVETSSESRGTSDAVVPTTQTQLPLESIQSEPEADGEKDEQVNPDTHESVEEEAGQSYEQEEEFEDESYESDLEELDGNEDEDEGDELEGSDEPYEESEDDGSAEEGEDGRAEEHEVKEALETSPHATLSDEESTDGSPAPPDESKTADDAKSSASLQSNILIGSTPQTTDSSRSTVEETPTPPGPTSTVSASSQASSTSAQSSFTAFGSQKSAFSFSKHAVRTSSPLGSQPPTIAETSTSPNQSPEKARSAFGSAASNTLTSDMPSSSAFSFFGRTSSPVVAAKAIPIQTANHPSGSLEARNTLPVPDPPYVQPSETGRSTPVSQPIDKFVVPVRPAAPPMPPQQTPGKKTLAGTVERMITDLLAEINFLEKVLVTNARYHQSLHVGNFVQINRDNIGQFSALPLSSAGGLGDVAHSIGDEASDLTARRKEVAELEAELRASKLRCKSLIRSLHMLNMKWIRKWDRLKASCR